MKEFNYETHVVVIEMRSQNCEKLLLALSCLSIHPSDRTEQLGSCRTDFHEILYLSTFRKTVEKKFKFHKNRTRITGPLREDPYTFLIISRSILFRMRNASDKSYRGNQNTYFGFCNFF